MYQRKYYKAFFVSFKLMQKTEDINYLLLKNANIYHFFLLAYIPSPTNRIAKIGKPIQGETLKCPNTATKQISKNATKIKNFNPLVMFIRFYLTSSNSVSVVLESVFVSEVEFEDVWE